MEAGPAVGVLGPLHIQDVIVKWRDSEWRLSLSGPWKSGRTSVGVGRKGKCRAWGRTCRWFTVTGGWGLY